MEPRRVISREKLFDVSTDDELIDKATQALARFGDGEKHTVAVAMRTKDGETFVGLNVYAMGLGAHAELIALGMAISSGHSEIDVLVAVGDNNRGPIEPCGLCRQLLLDYAPDAEMIMPWDGEVQRVPVRSLLPNAFKSWFTETEFASESDARS